MSPKNSLLATGLTALGLVGFARFGTANPPAAPSGPASAVAPAPSSAVLLLTNGGVKQGLISVDQAGYILHVGGSKIPYPKRMVVGKFRTLEEAYAYQHERLPERDPDESMKLARWCLTNQLESQAKIELQTVLALSPKYREAERMLQKIGEGEARRAARDSNVVQANAEAVEGQPERISRAVLDRASRDMGISSLPQIEGLSKAAAVRRVEEFRRHVHLVLQARCARCHNENYAGDFRLVQVKTKSAMTSDAIRANLDATLNLVDWENPAKSVLLSSTLRPHGAGTNKRPIFTGSNDLMYQILAKWINNLHAAQRASTASTSPQRPFLTVNPEGESGERFASRRDNSVPLPLTPTPATGSRPQPPPVYHQPTPLPPGQMLTGSGSAMQPYAPADTDFPVPYLEGGPPPKVGQTASADGVASNGQAGSLPPLPGGAPNLPQNASAEEPPKSKKPAKPVKIDPAVLERVLMNRNGSQ